MAEGNSTQSWDPVACYDENTSDVLAALDRIDAASGLEASLGLAISSS